MKSYASNRARSAAWAIATVLTLSNPWQLLKSAKDIATIHAVEQRLQAGESKNAPMPGDLVWANGIIEAPPLDLPSDLTQLQNSLMVVRRIEHRNSSGKHRNWKTAQRDEWVQDTAKLGRWKLGSDLIETGDFYWHRASPCTDYHPSPNSWTVICPSGTYAYDANNSYRRLPYEVTPLTGRVISLIATIDATASTLAPIAIKEISDDPFAIVAWGEQSPHTMLANRVRGDAGWMAFWWLATAFAVGCWMYAALGRFGEPKFSERLIESFWRTAATSAPFLIFFMSFRTSLFLTAEIGSVAAAALIGLYLWTTARARSRVFATLNQDSQQTVRWVGDSPEKNL